MIPALAHFVWLGSTPPAWVLRHMAAFEVHNPGWEVRLHTDGTDDADLMRAYAVSDLWCQRADIMYAGLLRRFGGLVVDCDSLAVRSFDPLLTAGEFWTTRHPPGVGGPRRLTNGMMGAVPGAPGVERYCQEIARLGDLPTRPVRTEFGPRALTRLFGSDGGPNDLRCGEGMTLLPWWSFYPRGCNGGGREECHEFAAGDETKRSAILTRWSVMGGFDPAEVYSVHLWGVDGSGFAEVRDA